MLARRLTEDEERELSDLNAAVSAAIEARRAWLDVKMHECSRLQVGDEIYNVDRGTKLGTVVELYRYHTDRNDLLDTSVDCHYRYETAPRCFDNTSRQVGVSFGSREDALREAERRASRLREDHRRKERQ
jgi:hypothetical protein